MLDLGPNAGLEAFCAEIQSFVANEIGANASKHEALCWAHAGKIEAQLRQEVQAAGTGGGDGP